MSKRRINHHRTSLPFNTLTITHTSNILLQFIININIYLLSLNIDRTILTESGVRKGWTSFARTVPLSHKGAGDRGVMLDLGDLFWHPNAVKMFLLNPAILYDSISICLHVVYDLLDVPSSAKIPFQLRSSSARFQIQLNWGSNNVWMQQWLSVPILCTLSQRWKYRYKVYFLSSKV